MENVITLGKSIGLLLLLCLPFLSILFLKIPKIQGMSSLARPVTGTIFLVNLVWPKYRIASYTQALLPAWCMLG